jgi:hypothetical protein
MKLYTFRTVPLSIIRSFSLYTQQWYVSYKFADSLRAGSGWKSIRILLASIQQTCMTHTIAVCTVKNSWWWTEELSETCRVSLQNKFEKLVQLVGFIVRTNWTTSFGTVIRWRFFEWWGAPPPFWYIVEVPFIFHVNQFKFVLTVKLYSYNCRLHIFVPVVFIMVDFHRVFETGF